MKKFKPLLKKLKDQKGVTAILVAVGLLVFLFFLALAIDIGHAVATKNQLQNVADSAALAGARKVGQIYQSLSSFSEQQNHDFSADAATIKQAAKDAAFKNQAGVDETGVAKNISINDADIVIGHWNTTSDPSHPHIDPPDIANYKNTDAVGVIARRDSTQNSPLTTFFAKAFGVNTISLASRIDTNNRPATVAALSGAGSAPSPPPGTPPPEGYAELPVGISKRLFDTPGYCSNVQTIQFNPTAPSGCAGWQAFDDKANPPTLRGIIDDIAAGTFTRPELKVGDTVNFSNGTEASVFNKLSNFFKTNYKDKGKTWTTSVVVYDSTECNPKGAIPVAGFVTLEISDVVGSPEKAIIAKVLCNVVAPPDTGPTNPPPSHGGGLPTGSLGSIPNLVQ